MASWVEESDRSQDEFVTLPNWEEVSRHFAAGHEDQKHKKDLKRRSNIQETAIGQDVSLVSLRSNWNNLEPNHWVIRSKGSGWTPSYLETLHSRHLQALLFSTRGNTLYVRPLEGMTKALISFPLHICQKHKSTELVADPCLQEMRTVPSPIQQVPLASLPFAGLNAGWCANHTNLERLPDRSLW